MCISVVEIIHFLQFRSLAYARFTGWKLCSQIRQISVNQSVAWIICRKIWGWVRSVRSSHQTKPYVSNFQTLNNPGSWKPEGTSKDQFTFHYWLKSFTLDDVKLAELSNNSFEWKNVTFGGVTKHFWLFNLFSVGQDFMLYAPATNHRFVISYPDWPVRYPTVSELPWRLTLAFLQRLSNILLFPSESPTV